MVSITFLWIMLVEISSNLMRNSGSRDLRCGHLPVSLGDHLQVVEKFQRFYDDRTRAFVTSHVRMIFYVFQEKLKKKTKHCLFAGVIINYIGNCCLVTAYSVTA